MKTRYPGAQPFSFDQQSIFFGREQELKELHRFINAEQLVVLYAKSGLGKSSLLNAGLIPQVRAEGGLQPLSIRFGAFTAGRKTTPLGSSVESIRDGVNGKVKALDKIKPAKEDSLWYHLKTRQLSTNEKGYLLVFDQFEELFSYPNEEVQSYAQQLSELLYSNIPDRFREKLETGMKTNPGFLSEDEMQRLHQRFELRVLMAIRSDRMSLMNKLKTFLPHVLENCYELRSLTIEEAESAILSPAYLPQVAGSFDSPVFDYEDPAVASLIDFLSEDRTQEIESFQLQILCEHVERQVILKQGKTFVTQVDIANPDLILENYYLGKINDLPEADRQPARRLIEEGLVFEEEERRLTLYEGQIARTYKIGPELLRTLLDTHLIRSEPSLRGGYTYELSHDTLVKPVLKAKLKRIEKDRIAAEEQIRLENMKELQELRHQTVIERKKRIISGLLAVLFLIIAGFAVYFFWKANQAKSQALQEKQKAEKLLHDFQKEIYNRRILTGDNLRSAEDFEGARKEYEAALESIKGYEQAIDNGGEQAENRIKENQSNAQRAYQFRDLIKAGSELLEKGPNFYLAAYEKFLEAESLNYRNDLAKQKKQETSILIETGFEKMKVKGRSFFDVKNYRLAYHYFSIASKLKPDNQYVQQKLKESKSFIKD